MKRLIDQLDLVYPPLCAFCECGLQGWQALCEDCSADIPRIAPPFCETCGESYYGQIDDIFDCPNCKDLTFHFEFARAALDRSEQALEMIHRIKYGKQVYLARELGLLSCEAFSDQRLKVAIEEKWPLIPVPLHWARKQHRHFNQAEEIARIIAREMNLPLLNALKRVRRTSSQTQLSRKQRLKNLKNAFAIRKPWFSGKIDYSKLPGAILVDDVFTTGSTVDACANVLRKAGVKRVAVVTVMRG